MPETPLKVKVGCRVTIELTSQAGESEAQVFTLVSDDQADFEAGLLGAGTPLAQTILGKMAGVRLPYRVGDLLSVKILAVEPGAGSSLGGGAARRQAVEQAVKHSDYVNAMIFAGAFNSKWGDYDIDKLDPAQWEGGAGPGDAPQEKTE